MGYSIKKILNPPQKYKFFNKNNVIFLFDSMNLFVSQFMQSYDTEFDRNNNDISGIKSIIRIINNIINTYTNKGNVKHFDFNKFYLNFIFEHGISKKHKSINKEYKQNRQIDNSVILSLEEQKKKDQFIYNKELFREYLELLSPEYLNFILNNYVEGDLVIAFTLFYYRVLLSNNENLFVIFSSDQDYIQLLNDDVIIFNPRKSMYITKENMNIKTKYNSPEELFFIKLLHGDKSDNIKGIRGIGNKRQKQIFDYLVENDLYIKEYDIYHLDDFFNKIKQLLENNNQISKTMKKYLNSILDNKELLKQNYQMINLYDNNNLKDMLSFDQIKRIQTSIKTYIENRNKPKNIYPLYKFLLKNDLLDNDIQISKYL